MGSSNTPALRESPVDGVWFTIEVPLTPALPPDIRTAVEVARITGRTRAAVERALDQGRIPHAFGAVGGTLRLGSRRTRYVRATPSELERWRLLPIEEVLARNASLPQDPPGWISEANLARALGGDQWRARRVIRRLDPQRLEWSGSPWRTERRYWIPDLEAVRGLIAGEVARSAAPLAGRLHADVGDSAERC